MALCQKHGGLTPTISCGRLPPPVRGQILLSGRALPRLSTCSRTAAAASGEKLSFGQAVSARTDRDVQTTTDNGLWTANGRTGRLAGSSGHQRRDMVIKINNLNEKGFAQRPTAGRFQFSGEGLVDRQANARQTCFGTAAAYAIKPSHLFGTEQPPWHAFCFCCSGR